MQNCSYSGFRRQNTWQNQEKHCQYNTRQDVHIVHQSAKVYQKQTKIYKCQTKTKTTFWEFSIYAAVYVPK